MGDISLTGQGFTFGVTSIVVLLVAYVVSRMSRRWKRRVLPAVMAIGAAVALLLPLPLERLARAPGEVPAGVSVMALPMVWSLGVLIALLLQHLNWWRRDRWGHRAPKPFKRSHGWRIYTLSGLAALGGTLLSLTFVNGFYRLYPTLGSLVGKDTSDVVGRANLRYESNGYVPRQDTTEVALFPDHRRPATGTVTDLTIPGTVSGFKSQPGYVYAPPIAATGDVELPVIVLMPGTPGLPHDWLRGGQLKQTSDAFAAAHNGIAPYVFLIDANGSATGDTECVDSPRGNVETYLTRDVPDYIQKHYDVPAEASGWAIGGLSLGGTCGIMTALRHPDVYRYFLDFAGDSGPSLGSQQQTIATLFGGSRKAFEDHLPGNLIEQGKKAGVGGYFANAVHDDPGALIGTRSLATQARKAGMDMVYQTVPGHHTYEAWRVNYRDALPWISNRLGATDCNGSCVQ